MSTLHRHSSPLIRLAACALAAPLALLPVAPAATAAPGQSTDPAVIDLGNVPGEIEWTTGKTNMTLGDPVTRYVHLKANPKNPSPLLATIAGDGELVQHSGLHITAETCSQAWVADRAAEGNAHCPGESHSLVAQPAALPVAKQGDPSHGIKLLGEQIRGPYEQYFKFSLTIPEITGKAGRAILSAAVQGDEDHNSDTSHNSDDKSNSDNKSNSDSTANGSNASANGANTNTNGTASAASNGSNAASDGGGINNVVNHLSNDTLANTGLSPFGLVILALGVLAAAGVLLYRRRKDEGNPGAQPTAAL